MNVLDTLMKTMIVSMINLIILMMMRIISPIIMIYYDYG